VSASPVKHAEMTASDVLRVSVFQILIVITATPLMGISAILIDENTHTTRIQKEIYGLLILIKQISNQSFWQIPPVSLFQRLPHPTLTIFHQGIIAIDNISGMRKGRYNGVASFISIDICPIGLQAGLKITL
jgi:hypothetical protein